MKTTIPQRDIKDALTRLKQAGIGHRSTLPALSGVILAADEHAGVVELAATDLEITTRVTLKTADAHASGRVLVPHDALAAVVGELGDPITVTTDAEPPEPADRVRLSDGQTEVSLRTMPIDDFPALPKPARSLESINDLVPHFSALLAATSTDNHRPVLTGVSFDGDGVAATDSYRVCWIDRPSSINALVPGRVLDAVRKAVGKRLNMTVGAAGEHDGNVTVQAVSDRMTITWIARTIEGKFVDYPQLLPDANEHALYVSREGLAAACERLAKIGGRMGDSFAPLTVTYDGDGETLTLEVGTGDVGEARETLPAAGAVPEMAFNPRYLAEALRGVVGDTAAIETRDSMKPAIISSTDNMEGGEPSFLLMPVRL